MLQRRAVQVIAILKERKSVTEACSELGLLPLKWRRKNHRLSLLMKILQDQERHSKLSVAYDEVTGDCKKVTIRSAARGEIRSVYTASHVYQRIY